jgi:hypothetical protein
MPTGNEALQLETEPDRDPCTGGFVGETVCQLDAYHGTLSQHAFPTHPDKTGTCSVPLAGVFGVDIEQLTVDISIPSPLLV